MEITGICKQASRREPCFYDGGDKTPHRSRAPDPPLPGLVSARQLPPPSLLLPRALDKGLVSEEG